MSAKNLQPCGTYAAYARHQRRDEKPCEPCTEALRNYMRTWRSSNARTKQAEMSAYRELAERHPVDFHMIYVQKLAEITGAAGGES